jgi:hypothetical protein
MNITRIATPANTAQVYLVLRIFFIHFSLSFENHCSRSSSNTRRKTNSNGATVSVNGPCEKGNRPPGQEIMEGEA